MNIQIDIVGNKIIN